MIYHSGQERKTLTEMGLTKQEVYSSFPPMAAGHLVRNAHHMTIQLKSREKKKKKI